MGKPLQIRDVPDEIHATLRQRADKAGLSLAAYALRVLSEDVKYPTMQEVLDRAAARGGGVRLTPQEIVDVIHAGREERE